MSFTARILLLGSGELGREFAISAKRLGAYVIACDSYAGAPAMQVADECEVFSMLDADALRAAVERHRPDHVVPEIEAIRTEELQVLEMEGWSIIPSARAAAMTMNRDAIRTLAADELGLRTSHYRFAESLDEVRGGVAQVGLPCLVKPVMSSSGKGQSMVRTEAEIEAAWAYAVANMRGDRPRVIVEEYIDFDYEITLLTVRTRDGLVFCPPIGHRQERGDYQESWQPMAMSDQALAAAKAMAGKVVDNLGGYGIFGVEFFVAGDEAIFSELSPRPHDTGMVTLISQSLSEFDLHARAILGLPIPEIRLHGPSASAVILADRDSDCFRYVGLADALALGGRDAEVDIRIFGKPLTRKHRRMGVALARAADTLEARAYAAQAAARISIDYLPSSGVGTGSEGSPSGSTEGAAAGSASSSGTLSAAAPGASAAPSSIG
ncbi:MAG TPA: formate-dependent phosphoribosylglycinamide formyltransferase [Allosphingosinicella sp.]|jgi:phosphoribosylglycinamide formyltransferase 2